jgi:hypothetical protein
MSDDEKSPVKRANDDVEVVSQVKHTKYDAEQEPQAKRAEDEEEPQAKRAKDDGDGRNQFERPTYEAPFILSSKNLKKYKRTKFILRGIFCVPFILFFRRINFGDFPKFGPKNHLFWYCFGIFKYSAISFGLLWVFYLNWLYNYSKYGSYRTSLDMVWRLPVLTGHGLEITRHRWT